MLRVLTKEEIKAHDERVQEWWNGIGETRQCKLYNFFRGLFKVPCKHERVKWFNGEHCIKCNKMKFKGEK